MPYKPSIYVVEPIGSGFIAMMARPVPGEWIEEEFASISSFGIDRVVSLLDPTEAEEIGLADEEEYCKQFEMEFVSYPIIDRSLPDSVVEFSQFTHMLYETTGRGANTVIHCRAGIGRAGLVTAGVLLHAGFEPEEAFQHIGKARRMAVPDTDEQRAWIVSNHLRITGADKSS